MKKVLLFMFLLGFNLNSQELLLHYDFDNNVDDSSGNGYSGSPSGVTFVADRNGNPNSAVSFDGVDDFIDFPNISDLKPDLPVSIDLWVKFDDLQPQNSVVFTTDFQEDNHSGVFLNLSTSGKLGISYGDARGNTVSSNRRSKLADTVIAAGIWYHVVAIVRGPTDMDIFVDCNNANGTYSGSGSSLGYTNNPGSIGRKDANTNLPTYYFKGTIDEFKYYRGVISPASEESIFNNLENSLCEGTSYSLPSVSLNGISGSWSPAFDSSIVGVSTFTFTPNNGQCAIEMNHTIEIIQREIPVFLDLPVLILQNENYNLPNISDNGISGNWSPLFDSSTVSQTTYTFTPLTIDCTNSFTHIITISTELTIPLFFTPNNDTINDFWKISGLDNFTEVALSVFDRYGKLVSKPDINIGWNGESNGKEMPSNDYWYSLFAVNSNNENIIRKGHFSLLRK